MDLNNFEETIDMLLRVLGKVFLYPFLFFLGSGSRIAYDYFMNKKVPTLDQIVAQTILGSFTALLTFLIMRDLGYKEKTVQWMVLGMAFIGYTALQWLLENWSKFLPFKKDNTNNQDGPIND